jgi:hypothetical protein
MGDILKYDSRCFDFLRVYSEEKNHPEVSQIFGYLENTVVCWQTCLKIRK